MVKPLVPKEDAERKKRINDYLKHADQLLKASDYDAAFVEVERALGLDPNNYYALAYRERILDGIKERTAEQVKAAPPPPVVPPAKIDVAPPVVSSIEDVSAIPIAPVKREFQRKLAAIMFTDMVNYTAITQKNEPLAIQLLEKHRKILRPIFKQFDGEEIKTIGDAFLVEFVSVFQAVKSAIAIQNAISNYNAAAFEDHRIFIRIGIHIGDVIYQEEDIIGDGVNLAARIQERAEAGGICVSQDVYNQIRTREDIHTEDMGEVTLKNVLTPVRLYKVYTSEEAYRKAEEKALDVARNEGRKNALGEIVKKYVGNAANALGQNNFEQALTDVFCVLAVDSNNAEANAVLEKIRAERARVFAEQLEETRSIQRQTFIDMYRRLLKRSWSDGSLSSVELTLLDNLRSSFQIGTEEHQAFEREIQREVYAEHLQNYMKLSQPSAEAKERMEILREELNVTDAEHKELEESLRRVNPLNTF
jgi:class 3 adenylate cyclase